MAPRSPPSKRAVLLTASIIASLVTLESNVVAVSLPAMSQSLHASFTDIEWVINAYLLPYTALLLAAGAYADKRGRKFSMLVGLCIFGASSAACGFAPHAWLLNVFRAVQGVGASMLLTAAVAFVTHTFSGAERTRAFGVFGAALGVALTVGPIVGGAMTFVAGWRSVFFINVPVCLVLIAT